MEEEDFEARRKAIYKLIAEWAYEQWENEGRPDGYHLVHWRRAEREIIGCLEPDFLGREKQQTPPERQAGNPAAP